MKLQKALWVPAITMLGLASFDAAALGTTAGTSIENQASLSFSDGTSNIQTVLSDDGSGQANPTATSFLVDIKVNFVLSPVYTETLKATNSGSANALTISGYQVTNLSNADIKFDISAISNATTGTDNLDGRTIAPGTTGTTLKDSFDVSSTITYYLSDDATLNPDTGSGGDSTITPTAGSAATTGDIAADDSFWVFATTPNAGFNVGDEQFAFLNSTVQAHFASFEGETDRNILNVPATAPANNNNTVEVVYADADRDNSETHLDVVETYLAELSLIKTAAVYSDPLNGTTNPLMIPGAVIVYQLQVINSGRVAATNVDLTDDLAEEIKFYTASGTVTANNGSSTEVFSESYAANEVRWDNDGFSATDDASAVIANFGAASAMSQGTAADTYTYTDDTTAGNDTSGTMVINDMTIAADSNEAVFISVTVL